MGLEDEMTIRAADQGNTICPDHRYPSAYQLLPAPNNTALWDTTTGTEVPRDFYQTSTAKTIGLDLTNLGIAKSTFASLNNFTNKPQNISYQFVVETSHATERGVDISFDTEGYFTATPQSNNNSGDGTVPIWSAGYVGTGTGVLPPWPTPGDHIGILGPHFKTGYMHTLSSSGSWKPLRNSQTSLFPLIKGCIRQMKE